MKNRDKKQKRQEPAEDKVIDMAQRKDQRKKKQEENKIEFTNAELRVAVGVGVPAKLQQHIPWFKIITALEISGKSKKKLLKLIRRVNEELKDIEEVRIHLINKYAKKDKEDNSILEPPPDVVNERLRQEIIARSKEGEIPPGEIAKMKKKIEEEIPKDQWQYAFAAQDKKKFETEWQEQLNMPCDLKGERITLKDDNYPLSTLEMHSLVGLINFEE